MVSHKTTFIDAGKIDQSRPLERAPKSNWKIELMKKGLGVLQYVSPRKTTEIVWHHFTKPGQPRFTDHQKAIMDKAKKGSFNYLGYDIATYRWGDNGPRILLSHGWNSKIADFRRMIEYLVDNGYCVEGIDMKAHGNSQGRHSALPEFRDLLKMYFMSNGPYHAVIGYSIGGMAAGIMLSELSKEFQPEKFFMIAAPSHIRYFFKDIIKDLGYKKEIYQTMCGMVEERYHQSIDYFDLRDKQNKISNMDIHFIYDEDDTTVPMIRGKEMIEAYPEASFVQTKGMGHYKIIAHQEVIKYVNNNL
ncbi:MAG: alpha/beta hydrolase [Cyclobacteriaceae bacterium]